MSLVIDLLAEQHREVLARIAAAGCPFDTAAATDFVAFLESDVLDHFAIEEDLLFPQLARHAALAQGPLVVMNAEHTAFRDLLETARQARAAGDTAALATAATNLAALLQAHIAKEDGVLFPLALDRLSAEQIAAIDAEAQRRKKAAV
jgi:hemerythrin-like domain-containing protein